MSVIFGKESKSAVEFKEEDIYGTRRLTWLSYFGVWLLIPFVVHEENPFVRYHVNQGISLMIYNFVGGWIVSGANWILNWINPAMAAFFFLPLLYLYYGINIVCVILGVIRVIRGKTKPLPVIGGFRFLKEME